MSHNKQQRAKHKKNSQAKNDSGISSVSERKELARLIQLNKYNKAQQYALRLTQRYPNDAFIWEELGTCLFKLGNIEESLNSLHKSLDINENSAKACELIAQIHHKSGDSKSALNYAQKSISIDKNYAQGHFTLAKILEKSGKLKEALAHALKAELLDYDRDAALMLKGNILAHCRLYNDAINTYEKLVTYNPNSPHIQNNIANLYKDIGKFELAERAYRRALSIDPNLDFVASNLIISQHYDPNKTEHDILKTINTWQASFSPKKIINYYKPEASQANKVINIGMISTGFHLHPVGQMIISALENIGPAFNLYAYSTNEFNDGITKRFNKIVHTWNFVRHLNDDELTNKICQDEIDILIDLSGHGDGNRLKCIAQKPAPLIVKWVGGLINTMGLDAIDYLISDHIETPEGVDDMYFEKLIRLPNDYICYTPPSYAPTISELPAINNGFITLGCFNNPAKINPLILGEWAKLMHELPGSRLFLKSGQYDSPEYCDRIRTIMRDCGIAEERLILEGPSSHQELLKAYNRVDIALDSWPYSGGLTTCEAFMMGVPVVTMPGPTFAGRHSATHLVNAGMPELVTNSWDEYRQRVTELASDLSSLSNIRKSLRQFLIQSPVCDAKLFGTHFSTAMRAIWQRYCEGKAPAGLAMDKRGLAQFEDENHPVEIIQPEVIDKADNEEDAFRWQFEGKIIAVDNGGQLLDSDAAPKLLELKTLELVTFDPQSVGLQNPLKDHESVHYLPNTLLGNGQPATFYACLDSAMSAILKPFSAEELPAEKAKGTQVLAQLPINTVALDEIEGLATIDWLILDAFNDSVTILEHGAKVLKGTLLIQARIAFQPTHERQPDIAQISHWAARHGFRFYRLHELKYRNCLPSSESKVELEATELTTANALFVPSAQRMKMLDGNQRMKLAFILDTVYGLNDLAYTSLYGMESADQYLLEKTLHRLIGKSWSSCLENVQSKAEANAISRLVHNLLLWKQKLLKLLVARCAKELRKDATNNTAHFVLTHALLSLGMINNASNDGTPQILRNQLLEAGWINKNVLYNYWFMDAKYLERFDKNQEPSISAILISNRYKEEIVNNARELRRQNPDIEIIFVNNGAPDDHFSKLFPLVDIFIKLNGNSGPPTARNIGAIFARSNLIIFIDDDGLPQENLIKAHLDLHRQQNEIVCLRGVYNPRSKNAAVPDHYNLGEKIVRTPPTLEGNTSFKKNVFFEVSGWGDYILFGHAGLDISTRLLELNYGADRQLYTPHSVLLHDYFRGNTHADEKHRKMHASWLLLETLRGDIQEKIKAAFEPNKKSIG